MTSPKDLANEHPFQVWLHPLDKDSEHKGVKQNIDGEGAKEALASIIAKPFRGSHYNKDFAGAFTHAEIVKREDMGGETWIKGSGYLWSGEDLDGAVDFISNNKEDIGISYEIVPTESEEKDGVIKVKKYLYKGVAATEKGENAYRGAEMLVADKGGTNMAEGNMAVVSKLEAEQMVKNALEAFKKDSESGALLKAKEDEAKELSTKLEESQKSVEETKKLLEELKPLKESVETLTKERDSIKDNLSKIEREKVKGCSRV